MRSYGLGGSPFANARTEVYENLLAAGVIDPTKVTRIALENAASIASMLLTTECLISDEKEEKAPTRGHDGGMCCGPIFREAK